MSELKAGRELNVLIAEKVMGWKMIIDRNALYDFEREYWDNGKKVDMPYVQRWRPSTDIAAVWEVVEKLRTQSIYLNILPNQFGFKVDALVLPGLKFEIAAESAPLAICLAALQAVGVEL